MFTWSNIKFAIKFWIVMSVEMFAIAYYFSK